MPFVAYSADYMLTEEGANHALYISLHSAYSASGANEISGGSPAYARMAATWAAAGSNAMALSSTPTFNVPASTVAWIGFWDALTSGNFQCMFPNAVGAVAYVFTGATATSTMFAPGTSYAANQTVTVFPAAGSSLPGGLTAGAVYYVKSPAGDSFQLSTTSGGSAISISADGAGVIQGIGVEVFASQSTFEVSTGSLAII